MRKNTAANRTRDNASETARDGFITRRDLLKVSALAGAVVGAAAALPALQVAGAAPIATAGTAAPNAPDRGKQQLHFTVNIEGAPQASANVESISVEDLAIDIRETTTGADWDYRIYGPGDAHYGNATIKCRVGKNSKELLQWTQDAGQGKNIRKNISVIIKSRDGAAARRYNLMECFPIRYDPGDYSPSSTVAVETIVVRIGRVEFA